MIMRGLWGGMVLGVATLCACSVADGEGRPGADGGDASDDAGDASDDGNDGSGDPGQTDGAETGGGDDDGTSGEAAACPIPDPCDGPAPDVGPPVAWNRIETSLIVATGSANHRGRDLMVVEGDPQWVIGKFTYGLTDKDLKGERVDVWIQPHCEGPWKQIATTNTTNEDEHATIEGVSDSGGRVYVPLDGSDVLEIGRHRAHMVVRGDGSRTDAILEVVEPNAPFVIADVDGTLTTTETEEFTDLLTGSIPDVNPGAPEVLWMFVDRGYRVLYLTARPEFLVERTRRFVTDRGLPPGVIHTTTGLTGALGGAAVAYKSDELASLSDRGLVPDYAFGNTDSDSEAYASGGIAPDRRVFFQFDDPRGGRRIEAYAELVAEVGALPDVCE